MAGRCLTTLGPAPNVLGMTTAIRQPSSVFPLSPLSADEATMRENTIAGTIALLALESPEDGVGQVTVTVSARMLDRLADVIRSTDVRMGYPRMGWPPA